MKKALVEPSGRVAQVEPINSAPESGGIPFPVAAPLEWRDCADDVRPETHTFDGLAFVATPATPVLTADELAAQKVDGIDRLQFEVLLGLENRTRALEGKLAITKVAYRQALIDRWKQLNP